MKKIFLSSTLISLLLLTAGCDSDTPQQTLGTTAVNKTTTQVVNPINITAGQTNVASLSVSGSDIDYSIIAGDINYFKIEDNTLYFKTAPEYLEGDNNQYKLQVLAKKHNAPDVKATKLLFTINVTKASAGGQVVITDAIAPSIVTSLTTTVDTTITLATDNVAVTSLSLAGADAAHFIVNGTTVTTPATAGTYTVTVTAQDAAGNSASDTATITVTNSATAGTLTWSDVEDNRFTWDEANTACSQMPNGTWRLPTIAELQAYSDTLYTQLPASATGSVIWSADAADPDANGTVRKWGWGYYKNPAVSTAQDASKKYFYTCVKSN